MAGTQAEFSDIRRKQVYQRTTLQAICDADAETAQPPASTLRIQRLFRLPYLLIEAVVDFNHRHSSACVEKLTNIPAAEGGDPWDAAGERELEARVMFTMQAIQRLVVERWSMPPRHAAIYADIAADELRQWIREEYENGRDTHFQAIAPLHRAQMPASPGNARPATKRKRRSNQKVPIDEILGYLETRTRDRLRRDFSDGDALQDKMVAEIYGRSAEYLKAPVNAELKSRGMEPVSAKTISRSNKYKSWELYRRHMVSPVSAAADCGPAFAPLGERTPTANDFVDAEVMENCLVERSGRRLRSGTGRRSEHDRAADEWANSVGVVLPPAN